MCGIATTMNGLEEFKNQFEVTATNDLHFYHDYIERSVEEYLYGRPKGTDKVANVFDQWKGVRLEEEMLPNHMHEGEAIAVEEASTPSGRNVHTFTYDDHTMNRRGVQVGAYQTNKQYETPLLAEHKHRVRVGRGVDGKSQEEGRAKQGLPQPPFIVLRYIIYWPD